MTQLEIYRAALEHIRDGHDAFCIDCEWCGFNRELGQPYMNCPECGSEATVQGAENVAEQFLEYVEPTESDDILSHRISLLEDTKDAAMWMNEVGCPEVALPLLTSMTARKEYYRIRLAAIGRFLDLVGLYESGQY